MTPRPVYPGAKRVEVGFLAAGKAGKAFFARFAEDCCRLGAGEGRELVAGDAARDEDADTAAGRIASHPEPGTAPLGVGAFAEAGSDGKGLLELAACELEAVPQDADLPTVERELCAVELLSLRTRDVPTPWPSTDAELELAPAGPGSVG